MRHFFPKYDPADKRLLHRLGVAIVAEWPSLPDEMKARILAQAQRVEDGHHDVQRKQSFEIFVEKHAGWGADDA